MPDGQWPDLLEVDFDSPALHRRRMAALRTQRIAAWGWSGLTIVILVAIVLPLFRSSIPGLRYLSIAWCVLLLGAAVVAVRCFIALARCSSWNDGQQPKVALRLSSEGLWLAGIGLYRWTDIRHLRLRLVFGRSQLILTLKPGVRPDTPTPVGLNELLPATSRRRALSPRGPRLFPDTLVPPRPDLDTAIRHYSGGRVHVI